MSEDDYLKLEELPESFFDDLREGNFVLVLGAGFSYGVPNKAGGKIPIGQQFSSLTKVRFNLKRELDYSSAAEVWETIVKSDANLLNEFRTLFLVDESKFDSELYSSIFIPRWYNIFTLNFDNVLEVTQQKTQVEQLRIFSYPDDGADSEKPDILHLHGRIKDDTTFEQIVFTPQAYDDLEDKLHTPYDVLHGDVKTHKKSILILGSQFKEPAVRRKFFKELPKNKSVKIYHFDIKTELEYVTEFTERDYKFVPLDESKDGVKQFLQFLHDNKAKIENIQIEGAEIINSSFVKRIKEGEKFSKADFYTAKQDEDCQWFGILNDYDVVRNDFEKIRSIALKCFDKSPRKKVAAVVHGSGGCGKSTLLRRLAIKLSDAPFKIVWLKDREFDNLSDNGLKQIQADSSRNYLVIIEDWYRITANEKTKEFLLNSQNISNLRIIIGDREIAGKNYMDNLYELDNQFHLQPEENVKIINDILSKYPNWKPAAEKVLKNNAAETTSLFLLLFVIARINEEEFGVSEIDFTDPSSAFRDIVKSDLKKINAEYTGLAKALQYWACIYSNHKIFIDFKSFLKVADAYNGNTKISEDFSNWNANFPVMHRLKNYINVNKDSSLKNKKLHAIDFVRFNHDKLAEDGLAYIVLAGWDTFYNPVTKKYENDKLLKQFLKTILEYGDDYFSSAFLAMILQFYKQSFNANEKFEFINKLYNKGNLQPHYLYHLADDDIGISIVEMKKYLYQLFDKEVYPKSAWLSYFKKANANAKHEVAIKILVAPDITLLPPELVVAAFNQKGYDKKSKQKIEKAKHEVTKKYLGTENLNKLNGCLVSIMRLEKCNEQDKINFSVRVLTSQYICDFQNGIVPHAFYISKDNEQKILAAKKILVHPELLQIPSDILVAAFNQKGNEKAKHEVAIKILAAPDTTLIQHDTVVAAFNQKGYDEESIQEIEKAKHEAAIKILAAPDISLIQHDTVIAAFNQKGYDEESIQEIEEAKYEAAIKILAAPDISLIQYDIVVAAFNQKGYDEESIQEIEEAKHEAAIKILAAPDITLIQHGTVVAAFNQKGYDEEAIQKIEEAKHEAAIKILEDYDWDSKKDTKMFQAIRFFSTEATYPSRVKEIVSEIINQFHQHKFEYSPIYYRRLNILLGYPFHGIRLWRENCLHFINNWRSKKTISFFVKALHSFRSHPVEIKAVCEQILKNWEREIVIEIRQLYGDAHKGDHIKIALGHPGIKKLAMKTAKEMAEAEEKTPGTLPEYLYEIVQQIVNDDWSQVEWNKQKQDESDS